MNRSSLYYEAKEQKKESSILEFKRNIPSNKHTIIKTVIGYAIALWIFIYDTTRVAIITIDVPYQDQSAPTGTANKLSPNAAV